MGSLAAEMEIETFSRDQHLSSGSAGSGGGRAKGTLLRPGKLPLARQGALEQVWPI